MSLPLVFLADNVIIIQMEQADTVRSFYSTNKSLISNGLLKYLLTQDIYAA